MRTEKEMYDLILGAARDDERVRAVILNGSRANPNAPRDKYQDYDIVYVVRDFESFTADHSWIDIFGERLMLQMPEAMRNPSGRGHFNWMMLFKDGNRLDLTLIPIEKPELAEGDSLSVTLLDKDGILPPFPEADDRDYVVKPPSEFDYRSCCNNFWWCMQNVAKGLARGELPYAMMMYNSVVREELHTMIDWYIGARNDFTVSPGKMGKYYRNYLPAPLYSQYCATFSDSSCDAVWQSVFTMCGLFHTLAVEAAERSGFFYHREEEEGMRVYLQKVRDNKW